jgi:hypothetical protein
MTEIFIEPELENLQNEKTAQEWFELASQLNLTNQISLADKSDAKKAPPYMYVDQRTARMLRTLCPAQVNYTNYKQSTIPLDVLQEIKKCEDNKWYVSIQILYDDKSPDPFVVGLVDSQFKGDRPVHLIARWGAELLPFEVLEQKAIERLKLQAKTAIMDMKSKLENSLQDLDLFVNNSMSDGIDMRLDFNVRSVDRWV